MTSIKFLTPNAKRQAADWLRRRQIPHTSKLLTVSLGYTRNEFDTLYLMKNHYVLILPASIGDTNFGIAWSVRQAGTYGISHSELSYINNIPFLYQASSQQLLDELRDAIAEVHRTGVRNDKLIFTPQYSGDIHYYQVTKKRGVRL